MASVTVPVLVRIEDCASWNLTVKPFIPQLYELPNRVLENIGSLEGLRQVYVETNPLISGLGISLALAVIFFVAAEINRNFSQVDRAWSILPNLYVLHFALWARLNGTPSERVEFLASATMLWSARLTFNYARKGGYSIGSEDYRWSIIRSYVPAIVFTVFDATFIATIQSVLLYAFSAGPTYILMLTSKFEAPITRWDWMYMGTMLMLVVMEYVSDGQQWDFHEAKRKYRETAKVPKAHEYTQEDLDRGFNVKGMWAFSRHPNFTAEQLIWFVLYQWSCSASRTMHNWSAAGSLSLILLFQGSTMLTEWITSGKYPDYKDYVEKVGCFMPTTFTPYQPGPPKQPTVIRTSELAKRQAELEGKKK